MRRAGEAGAVRGISQRFPARDHPRRGADPVPDAIAAQGHARHALEEMKEARRRKPGALAQLGKCVRLARLVAHQLHRLQNPFIGAGIRSDPEQFSDFPFGLIRPEPAIGNISQQFNRRPLIGQIESGARTDIVHPRAKRGKVAAERIDIEEGHATAVNAQVVQAVRQNQHAARFPIGRRARPRIVGDADAPVERNRKHAGCVAMRRQPEGRTEIEHPGAPIQHPRLDSCLGLHVDSQFLKAGRRCHGLP